jgi:hypothetical protein
MALLLGGLGSHIMHLSTCAPVYLGVCMHVTFILHTYYVCGIDCGITTSMACFRLTALHPCTTIAYSLSWPHTNQSGQRHAPGEALHHMHMPAHIRTSTPAAYVHAHFLQVLVQSATSPSPMPAITWLPLASLAAPPWPRLHSLCAAWCPSPSTGANRCANHIVNLPAVAPAADCELFRRIHCTRCVLHCMTASARSMTARRIHALVDG